MCEYCAASRLACRRCAASAPSDHGRRGLVGRALLREKGAHLLPDDVPRRDDAVLVRRQRSVCPEVVRRAVHVQHGEAPERLVDGVRPPWVHLAAGPHHAAAAGAVRAVVVARRDDVVRHDLRRDAEVPRAEVHLRRQRGEALREDAAGPRGASLVETELRASLPRPQLPPVAVPRHRLLVPGMGRDVGGAARAGAATLRPPHVREAVHLVAQGPVRHRLADAANVAHRGVAGGVVALRGEACHAIAGEAALLLLVRIVCCIAAEERRQLFETRDGAEHLPDPPMALGDGLPAGGAAADVLVHHGVGVADDVKVALHLELGPHGRGGGDGGVDEVGELEPGPPGEHAGVAAAPRDPLVLLRQAILVPRKAHEGGNVAEGLAAGQVAHRALHAEVGHGASAAVVAAVVAVLQGEHQRTRLLEPLHGDVAVHGVDDGGAVEGRALAADAEEDGRRAAALPRLVVDVVGLLPPLEVRTVEVVEALGDEPGRRVLSGAGAPGRPHLGVHGPVPLGDGVGVRGRRGGGGERGEGQTTQRHGEVRSRVGNVTTLSMDLSPSFVS
mmetsp:Transcript_39632/g.112374  ORF Transcript_39632/g.112374 Transcript_39632/m.112374 type:complete len:558 (+) Transcript_39632:48-1721(+)